MDDPSEMSDESLDRVLWALSRMGHNRAWLCRKLGISEQTFHNWTARGIPARKYAAIALALGRSVDWVAGVTPRDVPTNRPQSPMAQKLAEMFDRIPSQSDQLSAFVQCLRIIEKMIDTGSERPT